jgi:hypothetical protein
MDINALSPKKKVSFIPDSKIVLENKFLWVDQPDCNINSLPFEPIKTGNIRVKTKIPEIQNSDRAF